jgi:hypothetical protein
MTIAAIKRTSFFNEKADMKRSEYEREGRQLLERDITQDACIALAKKGKFPASSVYSYLLQAVYGPAKPRRGASE